MKVRRNMPAFRRENKAVSETWGVINNDFSWEITGGVTSLTWSLAEL